MSSCVLFMPSVLSVLANGAASWSLEGHMCYFSKNAYLFAALLSKVEQTPWVNKCDPWSHSARLTKPKEAAGTECQCRMDSSPGKGTFLPRELCTLGDFASSGLSIAASLLICSWWYSWKCCHPSDPRSTTRWMTTASVWNQMHLKFWCWGTHAFTLLQLWVPGPGPSNSMNNKYATDFT